MSTFGGIVSCNYKVTKIIAEELNKLFLEVVIANNFDTDAFKVLKTKKNLRLIDASKYIFKEDLKLISNNGEILVQSEDIKKLILRISKLFQKRNQIQNK